MRHLLYGALVAGAIAMLGRPAQAQIRPGEAAAVPASLTGSMYIMWEDDFARHRAIAHTMVIDGRTHREYEVHVDSATVKRLGGVSRLSNRRVQLSANRFGDVSSLQLLTGIVPTTRPGIPLFTSRRVLVVPCRTADEQTPIPTTAEYQALWFSGPNSVAGYWNTVSYGQLNITGTVLDMATLPGKESDYYSASDTVGGVPSAVVDTFSNGVLSKYINACGATIPQSVDVATYDVVSYEIGIAMPAELGAYTADSITVRGVRKVFGQTISGYKTKPENDLGFHAHELGHAITLFHSTPIDGDLYYSRWDVMAGGTWGDGLELQSAVAPLSGQLDKLGFIPAARRYVATGASNTITVEQLAQPTANSNYLMAVVPFSYSDSMLSTHYTVELRKQVAFDRGVPLEGVIVNFSCLMNTSEFCLEDRDGNGNPNDHGAVLQQGETFIDRAHQISITVDSMFAASAKLTIRNGAGRYVALSSTGGKHTVTEGTSAASDSIALTVGGPDAASSAWTATNVSGSGQWLAVSTPSGNGSGWLKFRRNVSTLGPGTYYDTLKITSPAAFTDRFYYDTLVVAPGTSLHLGLSVTARVDSGFPGLGRSDTAIVSISGPGALTAAWTATRKKPWGFIQGNTNQPSRSGTGPAVIHWSRVSSTNTPLGWYVDTITVKLTANPTDSAVIFDSLDVVPVVQYTVSTTGRRDSIAAGSPPKLDSAIISFSGEWSTRARWTGTIANGPRHFLRPVINQSVFADRFNGIGSGTLYWHWTVKDTTRAIYDAATAYMPGTYIDTITVTPPLFPSNALATSQGRTLIIDTVVVYAAAAPAPALRLLPASRVDTVALGLEAAIDSLAVAPVGAGADTLQWAANLPWNNGGSNSGILVFQSSNTQRGLGGKGPGWLRYQRDLTSITPGKHAYTIPIASLDGKLSATFYDTLVVLPGTAISLSRASHSDTVTASSGVTDSVSVFVLGVGATSTAWTATKRLSYTTLTAAAGTGSGTVRWTRDLSALAPGIYVDTITVSAGASVRAASLIDTLIVRGAPVKAVAGNVSFDADSLTGVIGIRSAATLSADLSSAGKSLGAYAVAVTWDSTVVQLDSVRGVSGGFAAPTIAAQNGGSVSFTATDATGHASKTALAKLYYHFTGDNAGRSTEITPRFTMAKSDAASGSVDLVALLTPAPLKAVVLPGALRGDVNLDGQLTTADALAVIRSMVNLAPSGAFRQTPNGDANCDGKVGAIDAQSSSASRPQARAWERFGNGAQRAQPVVQPVTRPWRARAAASLRARAAAKRLRDLASHASVRDGDAARGLETVRPRAEVFLCGVSAREKFDSREAGRAKQRVHVLGREVADPRLADGRRAHGERVFAAFGREARLRERQHELTPGRKRRHGAQHRVDGFAREIHRHAEPREERVPREVDDAAAQTVGERLVLEIDAGVAHVGRDLESSAHELLALRGLARRMVDLDDREAPRPLGLSVGERVHARAQEHVLRDPARERVVERILGKPAAEHDVRPEAPGQRLLEVLAAGTNPLDQLVAEEAQHHRIVEDARA